MKQKNSCQMYKIIKNGKFMGIGTYPKGLVELCSGFEFIEKENFMTYKEFEEIVSEWDMYIEDEFVMKKFVGIVAEFCESKVGYINTYFTTFNQLEGNTKKIFLQALVKLSLTPLDKREEVKELTVDEISELLGYKVKIKGEK